MKIKNTVKRLLSRAAGVVTALAGWAIYAQASEKAAEGAVAVTGGAMVLTLAFSVLCGFFVFLLLDAPSSPAAEEDMSEAEYDEPSSAESEGSVVYDAPYDEYPELFSTNENEKAEDEQNETGAVSYREALRRAMSEQKAMYVPENDEPQSEPEHEEEAAEPQKSSVPDIYDSIPDTLPEGYVFPLADDYDEEEWEDDEEPLEAEREEPLKVAMAIRAAAAALLIAISLGASFLSGAAVTAFYEKSISVSTAFGKKTYTLDECVEYEIAPSLFGDRLTVTLRMSDGERVKLLSSSTVEGEGLEKEHGSLYAYVLSVCEELKNKGVERTVRERKTIESELAEREDIGETVRKLIE